MSGSYSDYIRNVEAGVVNRLYIDSESVKRVQQSIRLDKQAQEEPMFYPEEETK